MQTGNGVESEQYLDMGNEAGLEPPVGSDDDIRDEPAINDLLAVAEEFNAAFNTALYELEATRKRVKERSARIEELNESILSLNATLQETISESRSKDEAHAGETEALNQALRELESERDRLRQQSTEQQKTLDEQASEISDLTSRAAELTTTLEQHRAESLRAAEAFAREREESGTILADLQEKYDAGCQELEVLQAELETRTNELAEFSEQVDGLSAEVASLTEAGERREEAHREESGRLHAELQALNEALRAKEELLQQGSNELDARNSEIASLNDRISELSDELESQSVKLREEAESHAGVCAELNDRIARISSDHESMKVIHDELVAHVEKLEQLNRALHESTISENDVHKKVIGEKDAAISTLREKLEAMKQAQAIPAVDTDADGELRAALNDLGSRLEESESQARMFAERASIADELEARVEQLSRELHEIRDGVHEDESEGTALQSLQARVIELETELEISRSAQETLAAGLNNHESPEQEEEHIREALKAADTTPEAYSGLTATVASLQDEIARLNAELSASREMCERLQAGPPEASWQSLSSKTPSHGENTGPAPLVIDRDGFILQLDKLLAEQGSTGVTHNVMYVLLDKFIRIRDEIGLMNSELVIDGISDIIRSQCDGNDMITRFGDCTFAVLCSGGSTDDTQQKAERIRSTVENHIFEAAGRTLVTSISIGICAIRGNDSSAEQVISRADLACESARLTGGNQVLVNSAVSDNLSTQGNSTRHGEIVDRVLAENRIKIYYQPISNLKDNSVSCFEVLTRVIDENSNIILPGEFFSMAVNSGKSRDVDLHVIDSAMSTLAENTETNIKLFIKLTKQSVSNHDFPLWLMGKIKQYSIDPGRLVFEVAERVLESELKNLSMLSRAMNKIGCEIAIEHYRLETRTQHLKHIHVDYLKIDSELVQNISSKGESLSKVTEILAVAKNNNLTTIAEGVETPHCLAILWDLGVNLAQGYFISEPAGNALFESYDADAGDAEANENKASYTLG